MIRHSWNEGGRVPTEIRLKTLDEGLSIVSSSKMTDCLERWEGREARLEAGVRGGVQTGAGCSWVISMDFKRLGVSETFLVWPDWKRHSKSVAKGEGWGEDSVLVGKEGELDCRDFFLLLWKKLNRFFELLEEVSLSIDFLEEAVDECIVESIFVDQ